MSHNDATTLKRLEKLASLGDSSACQTLLVEARRRGDHDLAIRSAIGSRDHVRLARYTEQLWSIPSHPRAQQVALSLGIPLDETLCTDIDHLLEESLFDLANLSHIQDPNRSAYLLTRTQLLTTVADARTHPQGLAYSTAGTIDANPGPALMTGLCLAIQTRPNRVQVFVKYTGSPLAHPGRCWPGLHTWIPGDAHGNKMRCLEWLDTPHKRIGCNVAITPLPTAEKNQRVPRGRVATTAPLLDTLLQRLQSPSPEALEVVVRALETRSNWDPPHTLLAAVKTLNTHLDQTWPDAARKLHRLGRLYALADARPEQPWWSLYKHLTLEGSNPPALNAALAASPHLRHFTTLTLSADQNVEHSDQLASILCSPHLNPGPLTLNLERVVFAPPAHQRLFDAGIMDRVAHLSLRQCHRPEDLKAARHMLLPTQLCALTLDDESDLFASDAFTAALISCKHLTHLTFRKGTLNGARLSSLLESMPAGQLRHLGLEFVQFLGPGCRHLLTRPPQSLVALTCLTLRQAGRWHAVYNNMLGLAHLDVLRLTILYPGRLPMSYLTSAHSAALRVLECKYIDESELVQLLDTPHPALEHLDLSQNRLSDTSAAALANAETLGRLKHLNITNTRLSQEAQRMLIESPVLRGVHIQGYPNIRRSGDPGW